MQIEFQTGHNQTEWIIFFHTAEISTDQPQRFMVVDNPIALAIERTS